MNPPESQPKKKLPQWLVIFIGLFIFFVIKETWRALRENPEILTSKKESYDEWLPLKIVVEKKAKKLKMSNAEQKKWCDCVLSGFKKKYPDGLDRLSADTVRAASATFAYDCIRTAIDTSNNDPLGILNRDKPKSKQ